MAEYIRQDHHLPHGSLEPHITNADRIRMMTNEELAEMLCSDTCKYCHSYNKDCDILDWLRKEAEDGDK